MTVQEYGMVRRVEPRGQVVPDQSVGVVLALPLLVLHHAPLLVQLLLGDGADEVAHPVALQPQGQVERVHRDVLEVVGPVLVGGAVEVGGAGGLDHVEEAVRGVLAAVEHQVLEQVGEAAAPRALVLGAHVVPDVDGRDRRLVVLVDQERESVGQDVALVRDVDRLTGETGRRQGDEEQDREESAHRRARSQEVSAPGPVGPAASRRRPRDWLMPSQYRPIVCKVPVNSG